MGTVTPTPRNPATLAMIADAAERAVLAQAWDWLRRTAPAGATLHADSRSVAPGDVFVAYAVKGADSRGFIADAVERGAAAVIWQSDGFTWPASLAGVANVPQFGVPRLDWLAGPLAALWYGEPSVGMTMLGVTGTNGKTSCSQWLSQLLSKAGTRSAVIGTLGSGFPGHLTVTGFTTPDAVQLQRSLADLRGQGAAAVAMEVSSHGLYQGRVNGVAFDVAVFTNLTQDHLDYHGTMAEYEAAKTRLFDWPGLKAAVVNRDDAMGQRLLKRLAGKTPVYEFGIHGDATSAHGNRVLRAEDVRATTAGTRFTLHIDDQNQQITIPLVGEFNVSNALAVLGAALAAGMPQDVAVAGLAALAPVSGRMEQIGQPGQPLVVVDYAHTPDALDKTLDALRPVAAARGGKLLCVFGCGGDRDAGKRPQMGAVAERLADAIVLTSDNPRTEGPADIIAQIAAGLAHPDAARRIEDRASAILQAVRGAQPADVVLIAGKGHESTQEIMGKKRPFSDQEHARLALAARATTVRGGGE
ncbi:UDP-N-acetylmuramoyl-L-alanyl-D-glutamate--2,6-diaminopimelate ligase [Pandoraea pulmonicola]|uniref:UDP-N-acetylmuramoyl-L-alanyl-D-glutamate--2,6-diaminopimelate ligase n=2 Tax=Pandoraea pulmonicola TaxID=93221 RepID=A0AAJ4ZDZ3_PANPU|nr:UDP-N-acetylmuramoyl-L-alanyl-D-glutamate--2,6-diaminopimelate ligase [Pandoraea pulmonicola]